MSEARRKGFVIPGKGAKAPGLAPRMVALEDFCSRITKELVLLRQATHPEASLLKPMTASATPQQAPVVKDRLKELAKGLSQLNNRLDGLSHHMFADGSPAAGTDNPEPYSIPDTLSMMEDLLRRALDRANEIAERI